MPVVEIENLRKSFGDVTALCGVNLRVERGEAFCVLGPDGAGKTTLLRIMAGVMAADSGQTGILNNHNADDIESAKQYIGYLSQRFSLYPDLSVAENIDFYRRLYKIGKKEGEERKSRLLDFSRLGPYINRRAKHLSGGMKQKLALSCALIHTPRILILDEPTTGVDPISRREFWKILYDFLAEGLTIVFATPYMDEAERASRVALLYEGKIINCDTPDNLKKLFQYQLAELTSDDNRLARQLLREKFSYENVVFFGDKLHLKVSNYETDSRLIKQVIMEAGINIFSLEQIAPGMEDVFVDAIT
ncbi:MAG: ABC transporter ATP-binding protein [candidate division Zixibacteria bacterium]|nr:ABC transporter ATP-binding protein [candidate division Zixibacteria bacterium]